MFPAFHGKHPGVVIFFASVFTKKPVVLTVNTQVLDIVAGYFTELPLQSHLQILANSIATRDLGESGAREGKGRLLDPVWDGA